MVYTVLLNIKSPIASVRRLLVKEFPEQCLKARPNALDYTTLDMHDEQWCGAKFLTKGAQNRILETMLYYGCAFTRLTK